MAPIAEAGVHFTFLGDPPTNCGTVFDLEDAAAKTDSSGHFRVSISDLVESVSREGTADAWRRGCFFVFAVKDCRTMAYTIASGEELQNSPVRLTALPQADIVGRVVDEAGLPVPGARVVVELYMLFVGRGPYPSAPVNFWLSRPNPDRKTGRERDAGLETLTDADGQFRLPQAPMMPQLQLTVSHPRYAAIQTDYYAYQPTLRLVMQPGAEILTRIRLADGNPAVGFQLVLEGDTGLNRVTHRRGATDDAGRCVFECLPAGDYIIRYRGGADDRWAVPAIHAAGLAKGERREIDVEATLGSVLYGRVLEAGTKAPVAHADVRFKSEAYPPTASTFQAAYTDHEGRFEFAYAVVRGALDVTVSAPHKSEWIHQRQRIVVGHEPRTELQFFLTLE